jgi:DNA-binding beta-propeller fold protein YncE
MNFAIPGLQNTFGSPKADDRIFTDLYGSIDLEIDSEVPAHAGYAKYEVYISIQNSLNHWENVFEDKLGQYVFEEQNTFTKEFWFRISYKELGLDEGAYKLTVVKNKKLHKEFSLNLKVSATYQQMDQLDVYIQELEDNGLSVYSGQERYLTSVIRMFHDNALFFSDLHVIRHPERTLKSFNDNSIFSTTVSSLAALKALKTDNVIYLNTQGLMNRTASLTSAVSFGLSSSTDETTRVKKLIGSPVYSNLFSFSDLRQSKRLMYSVMAAHAKTYRSILSTSILPPSALLQKPMESTGEIITNVSGDFIVRPSKPVYFIARRALLASQTTFSELTVKKAPISTPQALVSNYVRLEYTQRSWLQSYRKPPVNFGYSSTSTSLNVTGTMLNPRARFESDITISVATTTADNKVIPVRKYPESTTNVLAVTSTAELNAYSYRFMASAVNPVTNVNTTTMNVRRAMVSDTNPVDVTNTTVDPDVVAWIAGGAITVTAGSSTTVGSGTISISQKDLIVAQFPSDAAFDDNNIIFIGEDDEEFNVYDRTTLTETKTDSVGGLHPVSIEYMPDLNQYAIVNSNDATIVILDEATQTIQNTVVTGNNYPAESLYIESQGILAVANVDDNSVSLWTASTMTLDTEVTVGDTPTEMAYNPNTNELAVICPGDDSLKFISLSSKTVVSTILVPDDVASIIYEPNYQQWWVTSKYNNRVTIVDDLHNVASVQITNNNPTRMAYSTGVPNIVAVINEGDHKVNYFNANTGALETTLSVYGYTPADIIWLPDVGRFVVAYKDSNKVVSFDTNGNKVAEIFTTYDPYKLKYDEVKNQLYVLGKHNTTVTMINSYNL